MSTICQTYMTMAHKYLATKKRTPYFYIEYFDETYPQYEGMDSSGDFLSFDDDEMAILLALRHKYGDDFYKHLEEEFDDGMYYFVPGEIVKFDLDTHHYKYNFKYHQITDNGIHTGIVKVQLTDEEYVKLLALHLDDKDLNINSLKYADNSLYQTIIREIDWNFCDEGTYFSSYPYAITMDEARADARQIREQYPDKFKDCGEARGYRLY